METYFERALREKFRYNYKGTLTTEQLWDLTPNELNDIWVDIQKKLKSFETDSLLEVSSNSSEKDILECKANIIRYIVETKLDEQRMKENDIVRRQHNDRIRDIIARKKDEELENKSIEELEALLK